LRRETWEREGERSIGQNLAMVGMIGWLVVTPIVAGIFLGHWLDGIFSSGIFWTGALLVVGTVFGCILAWKRMSEEQSR
jgi:ATP synthase protein I